MTRICTLADRRARQCIEERSAPIPGLSASVLQKDADALHALRVACRRTRVALAEFGDQLAPGARREARDALRELRRRLGLIRELDVNLAMLATFAGRHGEAAAFARDRLERRRAEAWTGLGDARVEADLSTLRAAIESLDGAYRETTDCYRKQAEQRLKKRLKRLSRQYETWRETGRVDDLHDLRIRFKKMRYTLEVYVDLYGKDGKAALRGLESAQDALGEWNDQRVLDEHLRACRPEVEGPLRSAYAALLLESEREIERQLARVDVQTAEFFTKERLRSLKQLFGKPQRLCCDKER